MWAFAVCIYPQTFSNPVALIDLSHLRTAFHFQFQVLAHGAAVAWKSGMPFGIILHCSLEQFVTLGMAFAEGALTMDEDLEVNKILSRCTHNSSQFRELDTLARFSALFYKGRILL